MAEPGFLYVMKSDAEKILDMRIALSLVEKDFIHTAEGNAIHPDAVMMQINLPKDAGRHYFFTKLCGLQRQGVVGYRCAAGNSENLKRGQPESFGAILLFELDTCLPLAMVDERWSWELRVGAESGVAAKYLARPDNPRIGLLGAGKMARQVLRALSDVLPIADVRVATRSPESRERFSQRASEELEVEVKPSSTIEEAVADADIIVTATTADAPLVPAHLLKKGSLILSIGTYQELDPEIFRLSDKVIPDDREKCKVWGDLAAGLRSGALREEEIYAELGEIVSGGKPGRENEDEIILVTPQGMITQDIALAHFLYERACAEGLGQKIAL